VYPKALICTGSHGPEAVVGENGDRLFLETPRVRLAVLVVVVQVTRRSCSSHEGFPPTGTAKRKAETVVVTAVAVFMHVFNSFTLLRKAARARITAIFGIGIGIGIGMAMGTTSTLVSRAVGAADSSSEKPVMATDVTAVTGTSTRSGGALAAGITAAQARST